MSEETSSKQCPVSITSILEGLLTEIDGDHITLGQIIDHLNHRGFGPILALLALFVIIAGAIPLLPAVIGIIICLICVQMIMGLEHPWTPKALQNLKVSKSKLKHVIDFAKPYAKKMEGMLSVRYTFLCNRVSEIIIGLTCMALAIAMICIGFIPFLPVVFCAPILFFGIAYTVQDGLLVIFGFILVFAACWFLFIR